MIEKCTCYSAMVLGLILTLPLAAQLPVEGLDNQKKIKVVSQCDNLETICFPGELMDVIFRLIPVNQMNWKDYQSVEVAYVVRDLHENIVSQGTAASVNAGNGLRWVRFDPKIPDASRGWFDIKLYVIGKTNPDRHWLGQGNVTAAILPPLQARVENPYVGVSMPNGGGAGSYLSAANVLALKRLGVGQIRVFLRWYKIQPHEDQPPDWRLMDRIVNVAQQSNINVLPAVVGTPDWAVDPTAMADRGQGKRGGLAPLHTMRPDSQKFAAFLKLLVNRYKDRIDEWSIWNEPNALSSLNQRSVKDYAMIVRTAYAAIKQADPNATLAMAGLSGVKPDYLSQLTRLDASSSIEVVCVHPYRYPDAIPESDFPKIGVGYGRQNLLKDFADLKQVMSRMPDTVSGKAIRPIWVTEGGYNTLPGFPPKLHQAVPIKTQAQLLVRTMALANVGGVSRYYWWRLFDTYGANMGILGNQAVGHQPKPAYVALAVFERMAGDMHNATHQQFGDVHVIQYTSRNEPMTLAWTTVEQRQVKLLTDKTYILMDMMGMRLNVSDGNLKLTPSPVYVAGHVTIKP